MENTPSISKVYQRMTAWICRRIPSALSGVSHTKVQVLSSTHCVPPEADFKCPTPEKSCKTWASRIRPNPKPENYPGNEKGGDGKPVDEITRNFSHQARDKHISTDEEHPPTCCPFLPGLRLCRLSRRRRAKVAPFDPPSPPIKANLESAIGGEDTRVHPLTTEVSVFDLEDVEGQESPGLGLPTRQMMEEDFNKWRESKRGEIKLGCEKDEIEGISRESILLPPRPKTSRGLGEKCGQRDQPLLGKGEQSDEKLNVWTINHNEVKQDDVLSLETENTVGNGTDKVLYYWKNLNVEDYEDGEIISTRSGGALATSSDEAVVPGQGEIVTDNDSQYEDSGGSLKSSEEDLYSSRPKTSRGHRRENGRGDSSSGRGGNRSATEVTTTATKVEDKVEDRQTISDNCIPQKTQFMESGMRSKESLSLEEPQGSGEVLNIWRNLDDIDLKDEERRQADESSEDHRYDRREKEQMDSRPNEVVPSSEKNSEVKNPKSSNESVDAAGVTMTSEEECQYERQQRQQWQLAAIGEWATICQDYDEDDYLVECYLRMDEFQKEQAIMKEWKSIVERYHSLGVIQDLQNIQTLCKCTINQSERALRQFARICRGPVPLSKSGQTKTEAIASLSRLVQQQTRMISEDVSNIFSESYQIFEELDLLRERQDRVEEFLENDLRRRDAEAALSRSSSRGSTITPRQVSSRLQQREIDQDLADTYMEKCRVRSTDLFNVMPTIYEDKAFHLEEIQEEEESDFPGYEEMNDNFPDYKVDVLENETANDREEVFLMKSAGSEDEKDGDVEQNQQDEQDVGEDEEPRNVN
ncbi:uncharacterized protein LOC119723212 [Patiria miniata]|uniref:Uncharacterized protein n=1 Tax=Patiria miniata TaxID=46514 RepID=A0A913ZD42_PATMI|nr:uncharacterized protein LOC119723212 [Patiria miniata]